MSAMHPAAAQVTRGQLLDEQYERDLAALERASAHLPVCPWCDCKAVETEDRATRRTVIRCYHCRRQTLGPRQQGVRVWRRI